MEESEYLEKFERVVDLLRITGNYTAVLSIASVYAVTSDVETFLDVDDYVTFDGTIFSRVTAITGEKTFLVETFGNAIVAGVWKSLAPYSDFGTIKTINTKLVQKSSGEFAHQKFPLIALRLPTPLQTSGGIASIDANILIAQFTSKQQTPQQRLANTFQPILYPLTKLFLQMLRKSGEFNGYEPDFTRTDHFFYGTSVAGADNIANVFDDPLDAIELRNLKLSYFTDQCI